MLKRLGISLLAVALAAQTASAQPTKVDIELSLLVDVSGSVSSAEYGLQKTGYVNVFNNTTFWNAFQSSGRTIAVQYAEWSSNGQQSGTSWTLISNSAQAASFASVISAWSRAFNNQTGVASALNYGVAQINGNNFDGTRKIIDISSDGCENEGGNVTGARANAVSNNITINAITIGAENSGCSGSLANWYQTNVVTAGGFLETADNFADFNDAIQRKVGREVNSVPEPSSFALVGAGVFGLVGLARRRRNAA